MAHGFSVCVAGSAASRNGMTRSLSISRYSGLTRPMDAASAMRAILAGLFLCTAFALARRSAAEPSAETIARGKALVDGRRLRELPHRRSRKTVCRRQAHRHAVRRDLFAQPDAGPRHRASAPGASRISIARCALASAPDGSRYYPAFPYPYFTKLTRDDILADPRLSRHADAGREQGAAAASCAFRSTSAW